MKGIKSFTALSTGVYCYIFLLTTPAFGQDKPKLSDAQVAHTAVTANQIDIDYAAIAKEKSKDPEVLKFAETMANDHKAVIDQAVALVQKLKVTPQENAVSKQLQADAGKMKQMLRSKSVESFDRAYIENEVAYHKGVIAAVEGLLIPEAENKALKALLKNVLPALKAHLEHAQMVQKQLQEK